MSRTATRLTSGGISPVLAAALSAWAVASFVLTLLPPGAGGQIRALNAVLFLTLGPAGSVALVLHRRVPQAIGGVIALGASLSALVLLSEALLIVGWWAPWRVAGLVALFTVGLAIVAIVSPGGWRRPEAPNRTTGSR